ncbi:hypothetical protein NW762_012708 [Fusarium torreyae]|uniref:Uncharacterized protein n=1 Tax=Fusarium torreyae TaxID=1237075 RepID=A0A9W8RQF9_9HYPO|nr:hypothetical protein NW762_012708 [Fusarium torreyae]
MQAPASPGAPGGNVMTQAEMEAYQKRRDQEDVEKRSQGSQDDDEDEINYDSDNNDKASKQNDQRKRQEAHIAGYRQQMMKTTNGPAQIDHSRIPSLQGPWMDIPDSDDDNDIPLAMLQARKQNQGDRMSRLAGVRSNPNLRGTAQQQLLRPGSAQGKPVNSGSHLRLPSFASHLPQDPFQDPYQSMQQQLYPQDPFQDPYQPKQQHLFTGGLIGVIANEERAKASRRGSPSVSFQPPSPTYNNFGMMNGVPQMASPYGMPMQQPGSRPQTPSGPQMPMQQQMPQGLQEHMQFLQMMGTPGQGQHRANSSVHSLQSISQPMGMNGNMAAGLPKPSVPAYGNNYAQSIPPAERSNVGLPSRYRAVSKQKA